MLWSNLWVLANQARPAAGASAGWRQTFAYYTSYLDFWRFSVPTWEVFRTMVQLNVENLLSTPALQCLFTPPERLGSFWGGVLSACGTIWILAGVCRQARERGWHPLHFALLGTAGIILFWNYALADSYLMLFLPVFYLGLFRETRHLWLLIRAAWRSKRAVSGRVLAGAFAAVLVLVAGAAVRHYLFGLRPTYWLGHSQWAASADKEEAYAWIRQNMHPGEPLVAYEDANLFLHTGRPAMWLMAFTNAAFDSRDPSRMEREIAMLPDVPRHIGARYWLFVEGDFFRESSSRRIREQIAAWRRTLPVVYRSSGGRAEIHDLGCVLEPQQEQCRSIAAALGLAAPARLGQADGVASAGMRNPQAPLAGAARDAHREAADRRN